VNGETVFVLRRVSGATDSHGNIGWTWPVRERLDGVKVAPRSGMETDEPGREAVLAGLVVGLPAGSRVAAVDRMEVRGEVYEVIGEPAVWVNPWSGRESGVHVVLERVEG
jgi:hypothetical protein